MHVFRVFRESNPNIAWIQLEEGNINIESGIRMYFSFLDYNKNVMEKNLFTIGGEDFAQLGQKSSDIRIAIIEKLLEYTDSILVKE
jgi:ABC-type glucose/galactose transport system permease subunit